MKIWGLVALSISLVLISISVWNRYGIEAEFLSPKIDEGLHFFAVTFLYCGGIFLAVFLAGRHSERTELQNAD